MTDWASLNLLFETIADSLFIGQTSYEYTCPKCEDKGGKSFGVTRIAPGVVAYHCHRASCGFSGYSNFSHTGPHPERVKDKLGPIYTGETSSLETDVYEWLSDEYGFWKSWSLWNEFRLSHGGSRLYMPVFNQNGEEVAYQCKALNPKDKPKVLTYFPKGKIYRGLHYPNGVTWLYPTRVVIVEDILSSIKLATKYKTVALLGTHINDQKILEIRKISDRVVLFLDYNATDKALQYKKKYGYLFKSFDVVHRTHGLLADPKSLDYEDIDKLLTPYIEDK